MDDAPLVLPRDEHNLNLLANVHPPDWINPGPAPCYNLVVIGAGTAGLVAAAGAAGLGARVALIERGLLGGDCLNVGCVPSKAIIRASRAAFDVRTAGQFGVNCGKEISVGFGKAMERMRRLRAGISPHDSAARFKQLGVDVFFGSAKFTGPRTVDVGGIRLRFKKAAVCTGARAAVLTVPGLAEAGYLTNENVFSLTELPRTLTVIGGGPIGCELAQAFARMGSEVALLDFADRVLPREDPDASEIIRQALERDGVKLYLNTRLQDVRKEGPDRIVSIEWRGKKMDLSAARVLVVTGRTPNVEDLGLEKAGIDYTAAGLVVNDHLRTTNLDVYAAGDVCSPYKFTHMADAMARIVIANALFKARQKMSALVIPWCTYTDPEVAHVGMNEKEASEKGVDLLTLTAPLADVDRAVLEGETEGFARVYLKKGTDKILGATVVARHAGEMISQLTLAMTAKTGLSAIGRTIYPYPTLSEAIKKLADQYNRTRLTPFVKRVFTAWLQWQRK